jgi:hypothetical protein
MKGSGATLMGEYFGGFIGEICAHKGLHLLVNETGARQRISEEDKIYSSFADTTLPKKISLLDGFEPLPLAK